MTSMQCNVVTIFLFVLCSSVTGNHTVLNDSKVRQLLAQQHASSGAGDPCHGKECAPGRCIEVLGKATCFCPDGYRSGVNKCIAERCTEPHPCWPGKCVAKDGRETCLCPEGFVASHGICKQLRSRCQRSLNCAPGHCVPMRGEEVCLCPPGYYSERGFCKGKG
ncbi:hypothetical protein CDAR_411192 [Caerostris darwini]|uniref:EGF-like domain-containing protein n=1 Tax=Caerostris darwini TaxID=1538125 RepID=A0AAV4SE99_9ARAC|nr:hypothetical protein CDAR_411192 [Caerostris darwini]